MISSEEAAEPIGLARRYAALSAAFEPKGLLEALGAVSSDIAVTVTANLAEACDTSADGGRWLMRGGARQRELESASAQGLEAAVAWRRGLETDPATEDLLAALVGEGAYQPDAVLATAETAPDRPTLERLAVALDRAGQHAPAHDALDAVRSALGRIDVEMRYDAVLGDGFFGREAELAQLASWIAEPVIQPPLRALFVTGLPGIGKSTLVAEASRRAAAMSGERPSIVVRFDFDRGGLEVQDLLGLTLELSRQVAIALGEPASRLSEARLTAAGAAPTAGPAVKGETLERVPDELAAVLGDVIQSSRRPVLVVLDTMEVLRGRGETHPERLFRFLDELLARGSLPMVVVAAGRGDALDSAPQRLAEPIELTGLDPAAADAMLQSLQVPAEAMEPIRDLAEGNPLVLRLAAQTAREAGAAALDDVQGKQEVAAAYLYRFLLSRIDVERLRELAEPGLVVRRINPDVIDEVLAPAVGLPALEPGEAATLFEALSSHHWLVEPDSVPGWVRHRSDIRRTLLRILYEGTDKARAARVDRAAAKWFAGRAEPFAPIEAAYHQLQAMRTGTKTPSLDPHVLAQLDDGTLAELPPRAQDLVHSMRGERTSQFRAEAPGAPAGPDLAAAASELEALIERGDLVEAAYVHERSFSTVPLQPGSREADVDLCFLWRTGRWAAAARLARAHTFPGANGGAEWWRARSPLTALAQLELWTELRFADAVRWFKRDPDLAGFANELCASGIKASLANGALGFALLASGHERSGSTWSNDNPTDAAAALWADESTWANGRLRSGQRRAAEVLSWPATRFETFATPPPTTGAETGRPRRPRFPNPRTARGAARLLATSTPYGPVAESLRRDGDDRLLSHLSTVDFDLAERGGLPPTGAGGWSIGPAVSPEGSVDNLAALGLLAEWVGAAAFVLRHADLRQVALRAERWRRTTAGDWSYPTRPGGVATGAWARRPDATMTDRIDQLSSAADPAAACRDQLALWWGDVDDREADLLERIERRAKAAFRDARSAASAVRRVDGRAPAAAVALLGRDVPSAFVPPLAVLISSERRDRRRR